MFFVFLQLAVARKLFRTAAICWFFVMEYSDDKYLDFVKFMVLKRHMHSAQNLIFQIVVVDNVPVNA